MKDPVAVRRDLFQERLRVFNGFKQASIRALFDGVEKYKREGKFKGPVYGPIFLEVCVCLVCACRVCVCPMAPDWLFLRSTLTRWHVCV